MKKQNLLLIGGLGLAAYFLLTKGKGLMTSARETPELDESGTGEETTPTTEATTSLDAPAGKVTEALATAKSIVEQVKDAVVQVNTPTGTVTVGSKTNLAAIRRKKRLEAKQKKTATRIKRRTKKKKKLTKSQQAAIDKAKLELAKRLTFSA
jgi:hypothetical protein